MFLNCSVDKAYPKMYLVYKNGHGSLLIKMEQLSLFVLAYFGGGALSILAHNTQPK